MTAIYGEITRQDVRKAMRAFRLTKADMLSAVQCQICLVAQMAIRMFGTRDVHAGPYVFRYGANPYNTSDDCRRVMNVFDSRYFNVTNIDAFYKELKFQFPGKIHLANS